MVGELEDVDALELWGYPGTTEQPDDSDFFSLLGDNAGASIFTFVSGASAVYLTPPQILGALTPLGFTGTEADVDVDALMVQDIQQSGVWDNGDAVLFSIRANAGWDGGEIVLWRFGAPASFLVHGGHTWNTAFDIA